MSSFRIKPSPHPLRGKISPPPDKSITHRAIILSAISEGKTTINRFASNDDCLATINAFKFLGVKIKIIQSRLVVFGKGLKGLTRPPKAISAGESGTTMRLLLGVLAGQNFSSSLVAQKSLSQRPMLRVIRPLRMMGAVINSKLKIKNSKQVEEYPPLKIKGNGNLRPITYKMPVASAQVKSAILFAGLYCKGTTKVIEPIKTRDHSERMLKLFKADIKIKGMAISIKGGEELVSPLLIDIPGDISSASFFIVAAAIISGSHLIIKSVGLNPTRMGVIKVLKRMGADIQVFGLRPRVFGYEPVADISVKSSKLKGVRIRNKEMPSLIDEVPILMVAACNAEGRTVFEGVEELRLKETDRINSMMRNLNKMGANIKVKQRKFRIDIIITGTKQLVGTKVSSFGDHRTAMSMLIAGIKAKGSTIIDDISCINKSFPDFISILTSLSK